MPSVPVITINQTGKPAGVAGQARDDLSIYSGAGTEVLLADSGTGGTRTWQLLDQPKGAAAVIDAPDQPSISISGATIPGSYMVQLTVDGGTLPGQIVRLIFAVQIDLPSWVGGANLRKFRIPAAGETIEFNRLSSPASGPNARGWADEMNDFLGVVARNAFGTLIKDTGTLLNPEAFRTINFVGFTLTDDGSGQVSITASGGGGSTLALQNFNTPLGSFDTINAVPASLAAGDVAGPGNAQFKDNGTGRAALVVTNAEHIRDSHTSHIVAPNHAVGALVPTLNPGGTPRWTFAALLSTQAVITAGKTMDFTSIGSNRTFQNPPTADKALYDLVLNGDATVALKQIAVCAIPGVNAVVFDIDPATPFGAYTLETRTGPNTVSWGGGPEVPIGSGSVVRCYASNGTWADIKIAVASVSAASESWSAAGPDPDEQRLPLARAPYWTPPSAPIQWGFSAGLAGQFFIDRRPFGAVGAVNFDRSAIEKIEESARDTRRSGVVFSHRGAGAGLPLRAGGAELDLITTPSAGGVNLHLSAQGIFGGDFWLNGQRVTVHGYRAFDGFLPVLTEVIVYVEMASTGPQYQAFDVTTAGLSLVTALRLLMQTAGPGQILPLYAGQTDDNGNIIARGRVDLRRDVAHLGENTVASRELVLQLLDPDVIVGRASTGDVAKHDFVLSAEYESIGAALLWYTFTGQVNDSSGSMEGEIIGTGYEAQPLGLRVIGDTFESRRIVLWQHITITGVGDPLITLRGDIPDAFCIGNAPVSNGDTPVRDVHLRGLRFLTEDFSSTTPGQDGAVLRIVAPRLSASALSGFIANASLVNVSVEDCSFDYLNRTDVTDAFLFAGILIDDDSGAGNLSGNIDGLFIRRCIMKRFRVTAGNPFTKDSEAVSFLNTGIAFRGGSTDSPNVNGDRNITIEDCDMIVQRTGLAFVSGFISAARITGNRITVNAPSSSTEVLAGINMQTGFSLFGSLIDNNRIRVYGSKARGIQSGEFLNNNVISNNTIYCQQPVSNNDEIGLFFDYQPTTISVIAQTTISNNNITARHGIQVFSFVVGLRIFDNVVGSNSNGITVDDGATNVGVFIRPQPGSQGGLIQIKRNTLGARIGILLDLPDLISDIDISDNETNGDLMDASDTVVPGTGHGRGIYIALNLTTLDRRLVIRDNTIHHWASHGHGDTAYATGIDANHIAGIVIATKDAAAFQSMKGITIEGNSIDPAAELTNSPAFHDFTQRFYGIRIVGQVDMLTIRKNRIFNQSLRTTSDQAAIDLNTFTRGGNAQGGARIEGNRIVWISACRTFVAPTNVQPESKNAAAAIRMVGRWPFAEVISNHIEIQSVDSGGGYGYIHGLLAMALDDNELDGFRFEHNIIETTKAAISGSLGVIGSAVMIHPYFQKQITDLSVSYNRIFGEFNLGVDATSLSANGDEAAVISIAAARDCGGNRFKIDGNIINSSDFSTQGLAGVRHYQGIRVGTLNGPAASAATIVGVSINGNQIKINTNLDSITTPYLAGCIVLASQMNLVSSSPVTGGSKRAIVCNNDVERNDQSAGARVIRGILNRGFTESVFANNVVETTNSGPDIADENQNGLAASNLWNGNNFGRPTAAGTAALATGPGPYVPTGTGTNWSGTAFV
jgi:hypothetical protein